MVNIRDSGSLVISSNLIGAVLTILIKFPVAIVIWRGFAIVSFTDKVCSFTMNQNQVDDSSESEILLLSE